MIELLEYPPESEWDERRLWLAAAEERFAAGGAGPLSEQATALVAEMQRCFCAGAWVATVVLAGAVVDAQTLHAGFPDDDLREERAWLRGLRNRLMHENRLNPAVTLEDLWLKSREWEKSARRAVRLALASLYAGGGT